jgi:hypothetical protein
VVTARARTKWRTIYELTIDEANKIVAFASPEDAAAHTATPFDAFTSEQEFAELTGGWPTGRQAAIWNNLPGVTPVKKFKDRNTALTRIWKRPQLPDASSQPKAEQKAKGGARAAKGASARTRASKKTTTAKKAPRAKKAATPQEAAPRQGSKAATVVAMLQRKNGANLNEIAQKMGWQRHTVRGFMAGALKKAGYVVEPFKTEGGERS